MRSCIEGEVVCTLGEDGPVRMGDAGRVCVWVFSCCFRFSSSSRSFWRRDSSASWSFADGVDEESLRGDEAVTGDGVATARGDDGVCEETVGNPRGDEGDVGTGAGDAGAV